MTDSDIDGFFSTARISGRDEAVELPADSYLNYLYPLDAPQLAPYRGMTYEEFTADRQQNPFLRELLDYWNGLYDEPFAGVTTDGVVLEGLYQLPSRLDVDPAPQAAAEGLLAVLDEGQRARVHYPFDAPDWRGWSNPEFVFHRNGLRLEDLGEEAVEAILAVVEASLSPEGYARVREAMALNGYLGELVDLPTIMNDRSYWFSLFGTPDGAQPWGWQLFGHHVDVNFVSVGGRHVVAPGFMGAEPALSDGLRPPIFDAREQVALELAGSFTDEQRAQAVVYASVLDPAMPADRIHPADERHLAGAFRDNRVIPYEGLNASVLDDRQWELVRAIVADFFLLLKEPQRDAMLADVDAQRDQTWFCWYGATDGTQPFYFRVQSPVVLVELDHHAGVWLNNRLPARFHVHSTWRLPNGNDYGRAYVAQWRARQS
ncbi:MAG: DUF3500 domain-containing protein [Propionicimonas sp.]|uniref:DUF3500 domain-containing protein n=1 Tax=Propionicimonas sp. TaxID=1955623 RepID=UPI003D14052B